MEGRARPSVSERNTQILENLSLVTSAARGYNDDGLVFGDRVDEGVRGLIRGLETFDPEKGEFEVYLRECIHNKIKDALRKARRLSSMVSLDGRRNEEDEDAEDYDLLAHVKDKSLLEDGVRKQYERREFVKYLISQIRDKRTREIFELRYLKDRLPREIAVEYGISRRRVMQILSEARYMARREAYRQGIMVD